MEDTIRFDAYERQHLADDKHDNADVNGHVVAIIVIVATAL